MADERDDGVLSRIPKVYVALMALVAAALVGIGVANRWNDLEDASAIHRDHQTEMAAIRQNHADDLAALRRAHGEQVGALMRELESVKSWICDSDGIPNWRCDRYWEDRR